MLSSATYPHQSRIRTGWLSAIATPEIAFALVFLAAIIPFIGVHDLFGSSEAREAHVSRSIVEAGQYILPRRAGIIPSKPPLVHWLSAGIVTLTGWNALYSMRLLAAIFAAGILFLTVRLVRQHAEYSLHYTRLQAHDISVAAGIILGTSYLFLRMAGDARVDMGFSFFCMLAFAAFIQGIIKDTLDENLRIPWLFFCAIGCATLAKGPIGIVLPSLCCFASSWRVLGLKKSVLIFYRSIPGWLLSAAIIAVWYIPATLQGGAEFVQRQLLFENVLRYLGSGQLVSDVPAQLVRSTPPWFYLKSLVTRCAPWSLLFIALAGRDFWGCISRNHCSAHDKRDCVGADIYLICFLSGVLFFSLSAGRRHSYLLPLLPVLAIYTALKAGDLFSRQNDLVRSRTRIFFAGTLPATGILSALILLVWHSLPFIRQSSYLSKLISFQGAVFWLQTNQLRYSIVLLLIIAGVVYVQRWINKHTPSTISMLFHVYLIMTFILAIFSVGHGVKAHLKGFQRIATDIEQQVLPASTIAVVRENSDEYFDPIIYYLNHPVIFTTLDELKDTSADFFLMRSVLFPQIEQIESLCSRGVISPMRSYIQSADLDKEKVDRELVLAGCFEALGFSGSFK